MPSLTFWRNDHDAETTLYAELIRRGLPADYARRTADELDDHRADLLEDLRAKHADHPEAIARERLGETRKLAKRIARDYQRRSWFGRWPLVSFLLLPTVALAVAWVGMSLALIGSVYSVSWFTGASLPADPMWGDSHVIEAMVATEWVFVLLVAPMAAAWVLGRLALKTSQSRAYALTACAVIAIVNGLVFTWAQAKPDDPTQARMLIGVMAPIGGPEPFTNMVTRLYGAHPGQFVQLLAPMLAGTGLLLLDSRRRHTALSAPTDETCATRLAA